MCVVFKCVGICSGGREEEWRMSVCAEAGRGGGRSMGSQCEKEEEEEGLVVVLVMRPGFGLGDMGGYSSLNIDPVLSGKNLFLLAPKKCG